MKFLTYSIRIIHTHCLQKLTGYCVCVCVCVCLVFANSLGDMGSIPGQVIPKTQKMLLDASLLNTRHYMVRIKSNLGKGAAPTPTHWCSSSS